MKKQEPIINFLAEDCILSFGVYGNGRPAIQLIVKSTGEPMATATVNLPQEELLSGQVIIKNYSENEGVYEAMVKAGVISESFRESNTGPSGCKVCQLLIEIPK